MGLTYTWNTQTTGQTDADSPLNQVLMDGYRENLVFLYEVIGGYNYTPNVDHYHDGIDSKPVTIPAGSIDQPALKTGTASQSQSIDPSQWANFDLTGGDYTLAYFIGGGNSTGMTMHRSSHANYAARIGIYSSFGSTQTCYLYSRYIQSSPPYMIGDKEWGHFLFLLREISTGKIVGSSEAEDPPWAYNGAIWLPKDSKERIASAPHPFTEYREKDPAVDGLEIVMVDLTAIDVKRWKLDNLKVGSKSILTNLGSVLKGKGRNKKHSDYNIPQVGGFTDRVKIIEP
jgi:hypothetical protein